MCQIKRRCGKCWGLSVDVFHSGIAGDYPEWIFQRREYIGCRIGRCRACPVAPYVWKESGQNGDTTRARIIGLRSIAQIGRKPKIEHGRASMTNVLPHRKAAIIFQKPAQGECDFVCRSGEYVLPPQHSFGGFHVRTRRRADSGSGRRSYGRVPSWCGRCLPEEILSGKLSESSRCFIISFHSCGI